MNRTAFAIVAVAGALFITSLVLCGAFYNTANALENSATAQAKANRSAYDTMWKTVAEVAQVPDKYKDDFKEVLAAENEAKFGKDGSKALAQWFSERDLKPPAELYTKIQTAIEANRATFRNGQDMLADKQRRYADHLGTVNGRVWAGITGHPKEIEGKYAPTEDLDGDGRLTVLDYPIITSAKTDEVFATAHDDEPMKVF